MKNSNHISIDINKPHKPQVAEMGGVGLVLGVVLPPVSTTATLLHLMSRAERLATRAHCAANLNQIGYAASAYSYHHFGYLPPNLKALQPFLGDAELARCPSAESDRGRQYIYRVKPGTRTRHIESPEDLILACDHAGSHKGGRNVLFVDGRVIFMTEQEFQDALANLENAELARHLRQSRRPESRSTANDAADRLRPATAEAAGLCALRAAA